MARQTSTKVGVAQKTQSSTYVLTKLDVPKRKRGYADRRENCNCRLNMVESGGGSERDW